MSSISFPQIPAVRKTGDEHFSSNGIEIDMSVSDFWQWAASDLISNAMRGILAEYIVASALGLTGGLRTEWDAFDLITENGVKIEVKSSAYLQSWHQAKLSSIKFGIQPTNGWDSSTNQVSSKRIRQADIYIFCVLTHKDQNTVDPLNMDQWEFYLLRSTVLDEACPTQKTIGLSSLIKLDPLFAKYADLNSTIRKLIVR